MVSKPRDTKEVLRTLIGRRYCASESMTMQRTSLHLDDRHLKGLEALAKVLTQRTGSRVSASQIVGRLIREFLHNQSSFNDRTLEAIIVRDQDGTIRYWSSEDERIYGWAPQ